MCHYFVIQPFWGRIIICENAFTGIGLNVLGKELKICSCKPITGWFRDGICSYDPSDYGKHLVCAVMTENFLSYSKAQGNDLSTANPAYGFSGLKDGDHWCLCAERWIQAFEDGVAPLIDLEATHQKALEIIPLDLLRQHSCSV